MAIPAWNWLTGVYQAPEINPEEMDTSETDYFLPRYPGTNIYSSQLRSKRPENTAQK